MTVDRSSGAPTVPPPPRIEDVARHAGTSTITVSRTLRSPHLVAPKTRERVLKAIDALSYIPNHSASSLASRRSGIVAVLVPTIGNSIFAETVQGVSEAVADSGLQILLGDYGYSDGRKHSLLRAMAGRRPEGVIVVGLIKAEEDRALLANLGVAVVETWDLTDTPIDTVVGFSNQAAGALVARHFLAAGRRRLAFGGGRDDRASARARGFSEAAGSAGLASVCFDSANSGAIGAGRQILAGVLDQDPQTDAVFLSNDALGVGALLEAQARGIKVPEQLGIVGLGDLEIGRAFRPRLTTISVGAYDIGFQAGRVVTARMSPKPPGASIVDMGFSIVVRESG
jgi:LacI family gluconate utilization system Gnt-I transcriptional repressor